MKGVINIVFYPFVILLMIPLGTGVFAGILGDAMAVAPILALATVALLLVCTFYGAGKRALKAAELAESTLMAGETLVAQAIQHRAYALYSRRQLAVITDSRVLIISRGLLGGFNMKDIQWKDLKDVRIQQNVLPGLCGSNLRFIHDGISSMRVNGLRSDVASVMYARAQHEEQAWEEKRRVRAMEEARAAAGGVTVNTGVAAPAVPAAPTGSRMVAEINEAKALLDAGTISDAEFQEMKSKILAAG